MLVQVLLACSAKLCANVASDDNNETECTTHTHTQDEEAGRKTDLHSSVGVGVGAQGEAHDGIAASETEGRENTSATERWLERGTIYIHTRIYRYNIYTHTYI